ncbi:STAS-like domain-containing protein [Desulfobotulus sp.]|uniref:STAS-like domain-containing protein n=1 Tax=Desulfobotulus sp. TaxID=1940337 RepID=UPI002A36AA85|nr:STAS-like domain-containing protein [Desulfobotulus sp.]MDY0163087.1 STAS-like domain-containing protein [Desulfobotulus sp.]
MELSIRDQIGPRCIIREDGQRIYDAIHGPLKSGETVILDFEGVNQFASPFFNFAIGQLLKDISEDELHRLLQMEHLNETGRLVVERVIENAARYHGDRDYRKIVDDILEQQARESG